MLLTVKLYKKINLINSMGYIKTTGAIEKNTDMR